MEKRLGRFKKKSAKVVYSRNINAVATDSHSTPWSYHGNTYFNSAYQYGRGCEWDRRLLLILKENDEVNSDLEKLEIPGGYFTTLTSVIGAVENSSLNLTATKKTRKDKDDMGRTKRKSMRWQAEQALLDKLCIGESRHKAKEIAKDKGKRTPDGIYSWSTFNSYKKHCIKYVEWAKKEKGCKTLETAKEYIQEYLDMRVAQGLSAWTVHLECSAIMKMYGTSSLDMEISVPARKRSDIKRSRCQCEHDRHVSEEKNMEVINFCKGTGLRRHELEALAPGNILFIEDKIYIWVRQGKGGRRRFVEVLDEYADHVAKFSTLTSDRVFETIPHNIDVHSYRAYFACQWYKKLERPLEILHKTQKYYCRGNMVGVVYDKQAMIEVSMMLGHNRINIIANNYLWNIS